MTRSHEAKLRRRNRRSASQKRDIIKRNTAVNCVTKSINEVLDLVKIRDKNMWPRPIWSVSGKCYLCERNCSNISNIQAHAIDEKFGWLSCQDCKPWVRNYYLPIYSLISNAVLAPEGISILNEKVETIRFMRRSSTLNRIPFIQEDTKLISLRMCWPGRCHQERIIANVAWYQDDTEYTKSIMLSNIISSNTSFPQDLRAFLAYARASKSIISRRLFHVLEREYTLSRAWHRLSDIIGADVMDYYGLYSND